MALAYGNPSSIRAREVTPSDIKAIAITSPLANDEVGSPVLVTYTIESDADVTAATIEAEYSTDSGSNWSTATADAGHGSHSGTTSLTADPDGEDYTFVWNSGTDMGTDVTSTTVQFRIRGTDQTSRYSDWATTDTFTVDMLPGAPTLVSPADGYFDAGDTATFVWTIPPDPGADRIAFRLEIDDDPAFGSPAIDHNSVDDLGRFQYKVTADPSLKNAANGMTYYVKSYPVTAYSTAVTYSSLTDYYADTALAATLTNPQILLVNRADRRCFIDYATISTTGFTIEKSEVGIDTDGLVDLLIFTGSAGSFDTYWVNLTISANTAYTLGVAPFDTDVLGNTIPGTISGLRPQVLEGSDRGVFFSSVTDSGFTLNVSESYVDTSAKVRVCLRGTPNESYVHEGLSVTSATPLGQDYDQALDDATNGGAAWPDALVAPILSSADLADRMTYLEYVSTDEVQLAKSSMGLATNSTVDLHGHSEDPTKLPFWTDVSTQGVPDSYEGEQARYRIKSADALATGEYYWRVTGANIT